MKKLEDIFKEIESEKNKNQNKTGKYAAKITALDIYEYENSQAGIDTNK